MNNLSDYIKIYDSVIPTNLCQSLISKFDKCKSDVFNDEVRKFNQINIVKNKAIFNDEIIILGSIFKSIVTRYTNDLNITFFPEKYAYEEFRIKKYTTNSYFKEHVDVNDYASARRFLSIFSYLNETTGTDFEFKTIKNLASGSIVVFPPLWMYAHKAIIPTSGVKYFLGTYLHYI